MKTLQDIIKFVNDGERSPLISAIEAICEDYEVVTARNVCIKLLGWIRKQHGEINIRSLNLNSYPWALCLKQCVGECSQLAEIFHLGKDGLTFHDNLGYATINKVVLDVYNNYKPKLLHN